MTRESSIAAPIALLAAASGARSMTGIAAVARVRASAESGNRDRGLGPRIVGRFDRTIANTATALAVFEMMADKAPHIPDRINPGPLFGRVVAGVIVGAGVAQLTGVDRRVPAIAGAVTAFVGAQLSFRMRRALAESMPGFAAGLVEDAIVIGIGAAGAALLRSSPGVRQPEPV